MKLPYGGIFDFAAKSDKLEQVNAELEDPDVWNDPKKAQDLGKEKNPLKTSFFPSPGSNPAWMTRPNFSKWQRKNRTTIR